MTTSRDASGEGPATKGGVAPIPITIVTGFLGSGKTTLILNLVPQLRRANPAYRLALLKNEFGDVAVDSQLAASGAVSGVQELLGGCICCNLVGSLGDALAELRNGNPNNNNNGDNRTSNPEAAGGVVGVSRPDRIVVETSGSAFPATLAMEVNRLARATGWYSLDGVVSVVDVENWRGYDDTSYTARAQARYTDLVVFNKWEAAGERRFDECLDRLGDLDVDVAWVRSDRGSVPADVVFGVDGALARSLLADGDTGGEHGHGHDHKDGHKGHQSEVEVLSVSLSVNGGAEAAVVVDINKLAGLLETAPKDEVYRIKAVYTAAAALRGSDEQVPVLVDKPPGPARYILNWAFGRWTCTPVPGDDSNAQQSSGQTVLRMTLVLARHEGAKWKKKLENSAWISVVGETDQAASLVVQKLL